MLDLVYENYKAYNLIAQSSPFAVALSMVLLVAKWIGLPPRAGRGKLHIIPNQNAQSYIMRNYEQI